MKKLLSVLLALAALMFTGCSALPGDVSDVTDDTELSSDVAESTSAVPSFENASVPVPFGELGLEPVIVRGESEVAEASLDGEAVVLKSFASGSCVFSAENVYSEAAEIEVSVSEEGAISYTVKPFEKPAKSVNVVDFGAYGNDSAEDTEAIQKAIDSLGEGGGTVYIPAGTYFVSYLEFREGVHIRLAGNLPDAKVGYTSETVKYAYPTNIAVIRSNGKNSHLFYNLEKGGYCTEGVSDISLSGGMLDCITKGMAFVLACADGVVIENCIIKDIANNHAIQIDGCTDVVVRNVMFAGYTYSGTTTRETIQIECTTKGAISSNYETSAVKCEDGDFHYDKNVVITGCYFGKSNISGPHLTPLGHHSTNGPATCDGVEFTDNLVDNPLMYGLHIVNNVNVTVKGNVFISDKAVEPLTDDCALVNFYSRSSDLSYVDASGVGVTYSCKTEQDGIKNAVIEDNVFILGGGTNLRAVSVTGTDFLPGAVYRSGLMRNDGYGTKAYAFSGYVASNNLIDGVVIRNNRIAVKDKTAYKDCVIKLKNVFGLVCENNEIIGATYSAIYNNCAGVGATTVYSVNNSTPRYIDAVKDAKGAVYVRTPDGTKEYACIADGRLTLKVKGNGSISVKTAGGDVTVSAVAGENSVFDGWFDNKNKPIDFSSGFGGGKLIYAVFSDK